MIILCPSCADPYQVEDGSVAPLVQVACPHCNEQIILDFEAANDASLIEEGMRTARAFKSEAEYRQASGGEAFAPAARQPSPVSTPPSRKPATITTPGVTPKPPQTAPPAAPHPAAPPASRRTMIAGSAPPPATAIGSETPPPPVVPDAPVEYDEPIKLDEPVVPIELDAPVEPIELDEPIPPHIPPHSPPPAASSTPPPEATDTAAAEDTPSAAELSESHPIISETPNDGAQETQENDRVTDEAAANEGGSGRPGLLMLAGLVLIAATAAGLAYVETGDPNPIPFLQSLLR